MENRDNSIWLSKARELYNVTQERLALEKERAYACSGIKGSI